MFRHPVTIALLTLFLMTGCFGAAEAKTLRFAGHDFVVRGAGKGGPGPNHWDPANAWVDKKGRLHLRFDRRNGRWTAAEVYTKKRFGFGTYEFKITGPIDRLDRNVVLGLFNYPPEDVGEDMTNEIDIEFARWGKAGAPPGNFSVWPAVPRLDYTTHTFRFALNDAQASTHRFVWSRKSVAFTSVEGHRGDKGRVIERWKFAPKDAAGRVPHEAMPLHINLWGFQGKSPSDKRPVEIIIDDFRFEPL